MPWAGPTEPGEFPTLGYQVADLIQAKCAIPDGVNMGQPFTFTDEQLKVILWHYRIDPFTQHDGARWRQPFVYGRGTQLCRPQKWGKGPFAAAMICGEVDPDAPVLFDGWDANGQPVGRPWPSPHVQISAVSEDQTDNIWRALVPMIELGSMSADIPDTGITRINLPSGGLIEPVTASAVSRLGQRITFVVMDQSESWLKSNGGRKLADTLRRGLAGMGGRFLETPNAWDPAEASVAQETAENDEPGVYLDDVDPGTGSVRNKVDRRRMLRKVYGDSATRSRKDAEWDPWIDLDRIDQEIVALLPRDPAQAERWFLNRKVAGEDAVFAPEVWAALVDRREVKPGALVTVGVDGARFADSLAMIATEVETGHQWSLGIWTRPESAPDNYEHPMDEVDAALTDAVDRWSVWRVYVDPQYIPEVMQEWQGRWGEKSVSPWLTHRPRQAGWAVRAYVEAVAAGHVSHDGDPTFTTHIGNARKQKLNVYDDQHRQLFTMSKDRSDSPRKMDGAWAACLSWEARGDAIRTSAKVADAIGAGAGSDFVIH